MYVKINSNGNNVLLNKIYKGIKIENLVVSINHYKGIKIHNSCRMFTNKESKLYEVVVIESGPAVLIFINVCAIWKMVVIFF